MSHSVEHGSITEGQGIHEPKGVAAATTGQVYVADGAASGSFSALEGTEIASTGETGGTKFLREDGDNTCSWQAPALAGDSLTSTGENKGRILVADGANATGWQELVWKDLLASVTVRGSGPTSPSLTAYRGGNIDQFAFSSGDEVMVEFHLPHDYAPGTDIYIHAHWSHNGTTITGNITWEHTFSYAKGHHQAIFPAEDTTSTTVATTDIATTPQYEHFIDEVQLSQTGGGASFIDSDDLEPDGLILVRTALTALPTITGGSPNEPFLHFVDLHYQANYIGTANKAPNFYA